MGIGHETDLVPEGQYECLDGNMPATGLALAGTHLPARGGRETAKGRLGREQASAAQEGVSPPTFPRGTRELEGRVFRIGEVTVKGVELCEPCLNLGRILGGGSLTVAGAVRRWVGRGGLRVDILTAGDITPGARIERVD